MNDLNSGYKEINNTSNQAQFEKAGDFIPNRQGRITVIAVANQGLHSHFMPSDPWTVKGVN